MPEGPRAPWDMQTLPGLAGGPGNAVNGGTSSSDLQAIETERCETLVVQPERMSRRANLGRSESGDGGGVPRCAYRPPLAV
jgi:hypothetical protein